MVAGVKHMPGCGVAEHSAQQSHSPCALGQPCFFGARLQLQRSDVTPNTSVVGLRCWAGCWEG